MGFWTCFWLLFAVYLVLVVVVGKRIARKYKAEKEAWGGLHRERKSPTAIAATALLKKQLYDTSPVEDALSDVRALKGKNADGYDFTIGEGGG